MTDPVFVEKARELSHGFAVVDLEKEAEVAIASALREAAETARNAWQPIETAPRDGTDVLLYAPHSSIFVWSWLDGVWYTDGLTWSEGQPFGPTHWAPVPTPPDGESE